MNIGDGSVDLLPAISTLNIDVDYSYVSGSPSTGQLTVTVAGTVTLNRFLGSSSGGLPFPMNGLPDAPASTFSIYSNMLGQPSQVPLQFQAPSQYPPFTGIIIGTWTYVNSGATPPQSYTGNVIFSLGELFLILWQLATDFIFPPVLYPAGTTPVPEFGVVGTAVTSITATTVRDGVAPTSANPAGTTCIQKISLGTFNEFTNGVSGSYYAGFTEATAAQVTGTDYVSLMLALDPDAVVIDGVQTSALITTGWYSSISGDVYVAWNKPGPQPLIYVSVSDPADPSYTPGLYGYEFSVTDTIELVLNFSLFLMDSTDSPPFDPGQVGGDFASPAAWQFDNLNDLASQSFTASDLMSPTGMGGATSIVTVSFG